MIIVRLIATVLITTAFGLAFTAIIFKREENSLERLALGYGIGVGLITIIMFILSLLKIPLTLPVIILFLIGIFFVALCYVLNNNYIFLNINKLFPVDHGGRDIKGIALKGLIVALAFKMLFVLFSAIIKPMIDVDSFVYYALHAKAIFLKHNALMQYNLQLIGDKPLFPQLSLAWFSIGMGAWDDALMKSVNAILFISLIFIFYCALRRYYPRLYSMFFTFLLSTLPFIAHHATTAYADFPQTYYYSAGTIYLLLFIKGWADDKERSFKDLLVAAILLGISLFVKRGGLFIVAIDSFVILAFFIIKRRDLVIDDFKKIIVPIGAFMLIVLPWLIFSQAEVVKYLQASNAGGGSVPAQDNTGRLMTVITLGLWRMFFYSNWQLSWLLFILIFLMLLTRLRVIIRSHIVYMLAIVALNLLMYTVQFSRDPYFGWLVDGTMFDRLLMNSMPVVVYFIAEGFGYLQEGLTGIRSRGTIKSS